jgi:hypothetical protein
MVRCVEGITIQELTMVFSQGFPNAKFDITFVKGIDGKTVGCLLDNFKLNRENNSDEEQS